LNILITGATGFIGKNLVEALKKEGAHKLYALARKASKADFLKEQAVELIYADITCAQSLRKILDYKIDAVFHCAGFVENKNWDRLYKTNVIGTENICQLAQKLVVKRLIYLSSVAVVSGNPQVPLTEDLPYSATNLYGLSKIEAEKKVLESRENGLRVAILRPPMVYGEKEPHLQGLILFLLKYRLLPIPDAGKNKLHLVYVKNVAGALVEALHKDEFLRDTFFVADEEVLTVKEIFSIFSQAISAAVPIILPHWITALITGIPYAGRQLKIFLKDRIYDTSRIKSAGFRCEFKTRDSLVKTAHYWLRNR
jgi:nucleoside-diphosphate-sugar epimerase